MPATLPGGLIFLPMLNTEDATFQALGISRTAPQIFFNQQSGLASAASPTITGTVTPGSTLQASLDGGAFVDVPVNAQGAFAFTPSTSADGNHAVSFVATGANFLTTTAAFNFTIDTTTPVIGANQAFSINENLPNNNTVGTLTATDNRPLQNWTITGGNTNGAFAINAGTGQITVNNTVAIDREATASFILQVTVSDGVNTSAAQNVTISLNDVNDVAPVITPNLTLTLAENTANGTAVGNATATDGDITATVFSNWTITGGNTNGAFAINATTGAITVANSTALDREARSGFNLTLTVSDGINVSAAQNVTINLTDVNDVTPIVTANQTLTLGNASANGTVVGNVTATDGDITPTIFQNWTITGGNANGAFAINATTGQITLANNATLTLPTTLQITVSDGVQTSAAQNVTISPPPNSQPPVITANQSFTLAENTANGSLVGTVAATDADGPTTFSDWAIVGSSANGAFAINASTGQITVANSTLLDREARANITVQVMTTDGANLAAPQNVTINLTDVNDVAPVVAANQTFTLPENSANGSVVGAANATDGDVTPTVFQNWTITAGNTNGAFAINSTTGQITVANSTVLDREAVANFTLTLTVSDGVNTSNAGNITINLTDVNDVVPVITANQSFTLPQNTPNGTTVGAVIATDGDVSNTTFANWTITSGNANGAFAVNATTGQITVANSTALSGNFTLQLTVSDSVNISAAQNVSVSVTPNTNAPVITANQSFVVDENSANGTVVGNANATDADGPTTFQGWTITGGNANGAFAINSTTGAITVANGTILDREALANVTLQLTVSDGLNVSAAQNITIEINDLNDVTPIVDANQTFNLPENSLNGTVVGAANATDGDFTATTFQNWNITGGNTNGAFAIDSQTGVITVANATVLDREAIAAITLDVTVSDGVNTSAPQSITITLDDVNDILPIVTANQTFTLDENSANGTVIGTANATDGDVTPTVFQNWTITGGNANGAFAINATSGQITVANSTALDREATANFTLSLTVSDGVNTSNAGNITINLTDLNDVAPVVTANQSFTLPGNSANGTTVGTAVATDGDVTPTTFQNWTITAGDANGAFAINGTTGEISVANNIALTGNFTLQLTVSDGVQSSAAENVTVIVNVNTTAPVITANQAFAIDENGVNGAAVGTVNATDADGPTTFSNWTITGGNANGAFAINATTGEITVANSTALDREAAANFTLSLTVSDGLNTSGAANVTINLNDVNDVFPVIPANQTFTLPENSANGTGVGFANATDGDATPTTFQNWTITGGNTNGAFTINATTGQILVANSSVLDLEAVAAFNLNITVSDGVNTSAGNITINLTDVNDVAPLVAANLSFQVADNAANGTSVGFALATDGDFTTTTFQDWTIAAGNTSGTFAIDPATGEITVADNSALTGNFTLTLNVSDGVNTSANQTVPIQVSLPNAAPVVSPANGTLAYTEGDGAVVLDANFTISDADNANLTSASVFFSGSFLNGEDSLSFNATLGITGIYNPLLGTLNFNGTASLSDYEAVLRSVTYTNSSENPSGANRTFSILVSDGIDNSVPVTRTMTVEAVNDAPVITTTAANGTYGVGGAPVFVDAGLTLVDVDSSNLTAAVVFIPGAEFIAGEDVLQFTDTATITGSYDPNTGILQLQGTDSVANYEAALRSVTFDNSNATTALASRTISFQVSDGEALNDSSLIASRTIDIVADADAPVITAMLANDTGISSTDGYTANESISGSVVDASNITVFRAGFDGEAVGDYEDLLPDLVNGNFTLSIARLFQINNNFQLAEGNHTLHFIANDAFGNSRNGSINFTLDTVAPDVFMDLSPDFDSSPLGDQITVYSNVTVQGTVDADSFVTVTLDGNNVQPPFQAANGAFSISDIALTVGAHTFAVAAEDLAGNINNTFSLPVTRDAADLQIINAAADNATVPSNGTVAVTVNYDTDPANGSLSGLSLRLHFNSANLTFGSLTSLLAAGFVSSSTEDDTINNFDGDASTDSFILVTWNDPANWPGTPSATLFIANFTGAAGFIGSTTLRFTAASVAAEYDALFGPPIVITFV